MTTREIGDETANGEDRGHQTELNGGHRQLSPELGQESDPEEGKRGQGQHGPGYQSGLSQPSSDPELVDIASHPERRIVQTIVQRRIVSAEGPGRTCAQRSIDLRRR
jgi:hypothetical protein